MWSAFRIPHDDKLSKDACIVIGINTSLSYLLATRILFSLLLTTYQKYLLKFYKI